MGCGIVAFVIFLILLVACFAVRKGFDRSTLTVDSVGRLLTDPFADSRAVLSVLAPSYLTGTM